VSASLSRVSMKDDRFRIGLLLSPIANLARIYLNDLRERGDSSGQAILTFRLRAINVRQW
jgi:hypothetical protein